MKIPEGYDGVNDSIDIYNADSFDMARANRLAQELDNLIFVWKCDQVLHPQGRGIYPRRKINTDNKD